MGLIQSSKSNNAGANFSFRKILYKKPTENTLIKKVLPRIKVSCVPDKTKFKNFLKEMAGSSIRRITEELKRREEFQMKDKKKLVRAFMKHYTPLPPRLSEERVEKNINVLRAGEKAAYIKAKGGLEEEVGAKSRAGRVEKAKTGILTESITKANLAPASQNKQEEYHFVGVPKKPSVSISGAQNKNPFISAKSDKAGGGFIGQQSNRPASSSLKNLPPTRPENKPPTVVPLSR